MSIGENIKRIRKERQLTQEQLGELSGISKNAIYNYENDKRTPNIDIVQKIANALEVPLFLITRKDVDLTCLGMGKIAPNYDSIEKDYFPENLAEYYKGLFEVERKQRMEDLAHLILSFRRDSETLNKQIKEYEEYLNVFLNGTSYTLDSFLEEIDNEEKEVSLVFKNLKMNSTHESIDECNKY